ncbi:LysR family transcriptional regulator [Nocardia sp. 2]|uniref:LysR family transcriptional regulator n=1 Tax=Nocardia acididurans TaxID=2802282 RepID=A0ABS1MH05_9NOCA|nr:LysR family transcriptional regulator [Nocardia acididurans]MBL1079549.1 LysR family transcriptional regulator [Nocardia acididurans]
MDVDIRDLELLEALGSQRTLTAAARQLYVSQPALSQRLLRLEDRIGMPLFDRRGRVLEPTTAGRRMLQAAGRTLGELRSARHDLRQLGAGRTRPVRIASQCAASYEWMPLVLNRFRNRMPDSEIQVEPIRDDDMVEALLEDRLDVALVAKLDRRVDRVRLDRLFDDEMRAVVGIGHPWAGRDYVTAADFDGVHVVLPDTYDQQRIPAPPLPLPEGARHGKLTTLSTGFDTIIEVVASSDSVSVMPQWVAERVHGRTDVASVRVGEIPERRTWYCATRHDETSDAVTTFKELITEQMARR